MSNLKWKPKDMDANIGVPGKGFIKAVDFSQEDLDNLIKRAENRKQDVTTFLLGCGLVKVNPQTELPLKEVPKDADVVESNFEAEEKLVEEPQEEVKPKKSGSKHFKKSE